MRVLTRIDLRGSAADPRRLLPRAAIDVTAATEAMRPIVEAVREHGADAVRAATRKFDGVELEHLRVPVEALSRAADALDPDVRAALLESIGRARMVHADQRRTEVTTHVVPGGTVTQRWIPVTRVGLYVPGGLAAYPSSVVMNVVPAQTAGVEGIAVASPPQRDTGLPNPAVMAACSMLGIDEVYAVGGGQAIAMFGYGVAGECEPVDLITGPGNVWVTAAKRLLRGEVGIDAEAGPTEIAILADDTADPVHVAADLISQAEHDPMAASVLVTASEELVGSVEKELAARVAATKHSERVTTALTGPQSAVVLVDVVEQLLGR